MIHKMFTTHDAWHIVEVFIIFTTGGLSKEESHMLSQPNQKFPLCYILSKFSCGV